MNLVAKSSSRAAASGTRARGGADQTRRRDAIAERVVALGYLVALGIWALVATVLGSP